MASTTTIEDLHPDVLNQALGRMDGPTLAALSCANSHLRSLSTDPAIWRHLCLSTWPSLRHPLLLSLISHRPFFSDAFPFPSPSPSADVDFQSYSDPLPSKLISAVDLFHEGIPVFSRVIETETTTPWFLGSPFRIDGLDRKDPPPPAEAAPPPPISPEDLTLSWVVIDPAGGRAVNVSSRRAVAVERHWYTGETMVRFGVVIGGFAVGVVVTCGEGAGQVREVSLGVEDLDGMAVNGRESLVILKGAMEGRRRGRGRGEEMEMEKRRFEEFLREKRVRKERRMRREGFLDLCCSGFGAMVFLAFLMVVAFR